MTGKTNDYRGGFGMDIVLQILTVLFVVLWTARLARNKGRNLLLWAGAAAIPAVVVYAIPGDITNAVLILCLAPLMALIFLPSRRRPVAADGEPDNRTPCPRCQHTHETGAGHSFCTNCGWELARPYATGETAANATADTPEPTLASSSDTEQRPSSPTGATAGTTTLTAEPETGAGVGTAIPSSATETETAPAFSAVPLQITRPLTAAGMTESGLALFNQGRVREAVDQFTKAIALDPRYREAWANRARAYTQLGLNDKAAADRQQLEAI